MSIKNIRKWSNKDKAIAAGIVGLIGVVGVIRVINNDPHKLPPAFWRNVQRTDNPKYHIRSKQTFAGNEYFDDCPGAMVGPGTLYRIHSRAMHKLDASAGDVIRIYRIANDGSIIIDKHAVITSMVGLRTIEVNRLLWGGHDNEDNPDARIKGGEINIPQTKDDATIYHVFIEHVGYIIDWNKINIVRY